MHATAPFLLLYLLAEAENAVGDTVAGKYLPLPGAGLADVSQVALHPDFALSALVYDSYPLAPAAGYAVSLAPVLDSAATGAFGLLYVLHNVGFCPEITIS
ncbi:hypothetical protein F0P96_04440 [Hymenobacter busanensis]|uniref:Uncharacterized protein n=1 Tax=Hymenobacter busanensis TaxID=2607656 RepID=A0AA88FKG0_9BACT|nr:hypothetical protein [Hymenobacter busanensis]KAA9339871.1 hypothetical protein F0P96_04440 [Hymenobacter busanensis]